MLGLIIDKSVDIDPVRRRQDRQKGAIVLNGSTHRPPAGLKFVLYSYRVRGDVQNDNPGRTDTKYQLAICGEGKAEYFSLWERGRRAH